MDERQRIKWRHYLPYIASALTVLAVLGIYWLTMTIRRNAWSRDAQAAALLREIQSYQEQQRGIQEEIRQHLLEAEGAQGLGYLCLTAQVESAQELTQVEQSIGALQVPLTVVLDMELDEETRRELLEAVERHENWCVIFTGTREGWQEQADALAGEFPQAVKFAYFPDADPDPEGLEGLQWLGYSPNLGNSGEIQTKFHVNGLSSVGHILLQEDNSLLTVADAAVEQSAGFLLSVEMEDLGDTFTTSTVTRVLKRFDTDYLSQGTIRAVTVSEYFVLAREAQLVREEAQRITDEYVAQMQKRIDALQVRIDALYDQVEALEYGYEG